MKEQGTIILIPSFEPNKKFINYIQQLKNYFSSIVVVNDGSKRNTSQYLIASINMMKFKLLATTQIKEKDTH